MAKKSPKFDPSRPHGKIIPPDNGACFFQDGLYFRGDGSHIAKAGDPAPQEEEQQQSTQAGADSADTDQVTKQLAAGDDAKK